MHNWRFSRLFSEMGGARALVQVPLDRWRGGACFMYITNFDDVSSF